MNIKITPELKIQLRLMACIDPEYVSDLIFALIETIEGIRQDEEDMCYPLRMAYIYWTTGDRLESLKVYHE